MIVHTFSENSSATEEGEFGNLYFKPDANLGGGDVLFLFVGIREPIVGDGSLNIKVQESNYETYGFIDVIGLNLTVYENMPDRVYYVGIQKRKYLKAIKTIQGNIRSGRVRVHLDNERPVVPVEQLFPGVR